MFALSAEIVVSDFFSTDKYLLWSFLYVYSHWPAPLTVVVVVLKGLKSLGPSGLLPACLAAWSNVAVTFSV